jgi:hypothetical protein
MLAAPAGAAPPVLGERAADGRVAVPQGTAWAVTGRARENARVDELRVAVTRSSRARAVVAGLYGGRRGRLLAAGRVAVRPRTGGWMRVPLQATAVHAGRRYRIAVLPRGGRLVARAASRSCRAAVGDRRRSLARRWRTARRSRRCGPAMFLMAADAAAPTPTEGPAQGDSASEVDAGRSSPAPAGPPPSDPLPAGTTLRPPAAPVVAASRTAPLIRYGRHYPGGAYVNEGWGGGASMVLAMAAYAGDASADARLLAQIRDTVAGGHEPAANGGYPAQHERWVTGMLAVARHTPRVWKRLSPAERRRADLVMTGALVASAFTTSDGNPYLLAGSQQYTLDGDANVNRDWNPNMREGMVGMAVVGAAYFGGGAAAQAVVDGWSHTPFLAALRDAGLTNMADTFAWKEEHPASPAPAPAQLEAAVHGYRYYGLGLDQPMAIFRRLTEDTYAKHVNCGLNGGAGIATSQGAAGLLTTGCDALPRKGAAGMLKEFDVIDGNGPRSSAHYSYDGYRGNLTNHLVMLAGGLWQPGADADAIVARLRVGVPDLWYKLDRGYRGYAKGSIQPIPGVSDYVMRSDNPNFAFPFARSLWEDVVRPYHDG